MRVFTQGQEALASLHDRAYNVQAASAHVHATLSVSQNMVLRDQGHVEASWARRAQAKLTDTDTDTDTEPILDSLLVLVLILVVVSTLLPVLTTLSSS